MVKSLRINNKKIYVCICALIVLFVSVLCLNRVKSNNKCLNIKTNLMSKCNKISVWIKNIIMGGKL